MKFKCINIATNVNSATYALFGKNACVGTALADMYCVCGEPLVLVLVKSLEYKKAKTVQVQQIFALTVHTPL